VKSKVHDHAFMNGRCEDFLEQRMSYSIGATTNIDSGAYRGDGISAQDPPVSPDNTLESSSQHADETNNTNENNRRYDHTQCSICLEPFAVGEDISFSRNLTHCRHVYHTECVTPWLIRNADCPICRAPFFTRHDTDLKIEGCCSLRSCFGKGKAGGTEIDDDTEEKILFEYRDGAKFCVEHGLIFPPGYVVLTRSDEELYGVARQRRMSNNITTNNNEDHFCDIENQKGYHAVGGSDDDGLIGDHDGLIASNAHDFCEHGLLMVPTSKLCHGQDDEYHDALTPIENQDKELLDPDKSQT